MFRRILLLLIFALAMPSAVAMPACAADSVGERAHSGHPPQPRKQERQKPGEQRCVGCVAPSMMNPPMLEAPTPALLMIPAAMLVTGTAYAQAAPTSPPPKHG